MASSAFRSTTKRSQVGGPSKATSSDDVTSSSGNRRLRRSRSLSRNPVRRKAPPTAEDELRTRKDRFVKSARGSELPDMSLDDLADEFFMAIERNSGEESTRSIGRLSRSTAASDSVRRRGRSDSRGNGGGFGGSGMLVNNRGSKGEMENRQSRRRSLSVARYQSRQSEVGALQGKNNSIQKGVSDGDARRRRSASVARYGSSDLEGGELDRKGILGNNVRLKNVSDSNLRRRRSLSVARYHGSDSESYSSSLTEDEGWHAHANRNGFEKTIQGIYAQNKVDHSIGDRAETGLYEAMREQVRHAVEEMRTEFEQVMGKGRSNGITNSNGVQSRNSDITNNVTEIRSYTTELEKRSNDKTRMSKHLNKEAEMYFENFMSSVEDTDVSSFDGEKSDMNSTLGGSINSKNLLHCAIDETAENLARTTSSPVDSDGVILPWLEWETSSDCSPLLCKSNTTGNNLLNSSLETSPLYNNNSCFTSSHGSCSPGGDDCPSMVSKGEIIRDSDETGCHISTSRSKSAFNMEDYLQLQRSEDLLLERLRFRPRIESGGLVFCGAGFI